MDLKMMFSPLLERKALAEKREDHRRPLRIRLLWVWGLGFGVIEGERETEREGEGGRGREGERGRERGRETGYGRVSPELTKKYSPIIGVLDPPERGEKTGNSYPKIIMLVCFWSPA
jgi:hypothetical protein